MAWVSTPFCGYSVEFSPFRGNLLAVGTAQYFGIVGNGRLQVVDMGAPGGMPAPVCEWMTRDGVYDVAWSEENEHVIASAHGDGSVKLYDMKNPQGPIASYEEHGAEVYGVDWNLNLRQLIASASWDRTIKVWDVVQCRCVGTYPAHTNIAYAAIWAPTKPAVLASVAGDAMLHIMDVNAGMQPVQSIQAHQHEVLTVDWSKYNEFVVVTGSVDKTLRVFDLRNPSGPTQILYGHQLAVRRVKTHPHFENLIMSCSYDMSANLWDISMGQMVQHYDHHTEFVLGVDFNLFDENLVATASWDRTVCIWNCGQGRPPPPPPGVIQQRRGPPGAPPPGAPLK